MGQLLVLLTNNIKVKAYELNFLIISLQDTKNLTCYR
jgi:hypothetical protein